jgi:hypothetical protein
MACAICETRRPKRFCPGVGGDICSLCCGTEREVSVDCPLECEFLQEARRHERPAPPDPATLPNQDIRVTEDFLRDNELLLAAVSRTLAGAALGTPGVVDSDLRDALDSLARTYRTLQSGVIYDSVPSNPYAARMYATVQGAVAQFRTGERERLGLAKTRDADALGVLVFLQRVEYDRSNGRRRGRAFIDFLRAFGAPAEGTAHPPEPPPLIGR